MEGVEVRELVEGVEVRGVGPVVRLGVNVRPEVVGVLRDVLAGAVVRFVVVVRVEEDAVL